jgi:DNA-binding HxlR family transcriptional regulator
MAGRPYNQYCGVARALDQVGERWSLLIVRDLLTGPQRYTDLQHRLAGIPSDMLANRLRHLEAAGVVRRSVLPPPAGSKVYELTDRGRALEATIVELARWGADLLGEPAPDDAFHVHWLALSLRSRFRPDRAAGDDLTIHFVVDGETLAVDVRLGRLTTRDAPPEDESPDVLVAAEPAALAAAARGEATGDRVRLAGRPGAIKRFSAMFGLEQ